MLVARHDLAFLASWPLHDALLASAAEGEHEVWLPLDCATGTCAAAAPAAAAPAAAPPSGAPSSEGAFAVPRGCELKGRLCPVGYAPREWFVGKDWLFGGSSYAADVMGDVVDRFQSHSAELARRWPYSATHFLWAFHATASGLRIRWGLLRADDVILARAERAQPPSDEQIDEADVEEEPIGSDGRNVAGGVGGGRHRGGGDSLLPERTCYYETALRPSNRVAPESLRHAEVMNYQCPLAQALACPCSRGGALGLVPTPNFTESPVESARSIS